VALPTIEAPLSDAQDDLVAAYRVIAQPYPAMVVNPSRWAGALRANFELRSLLDEQLNSATFAALGLEQTQLRQQHHVLNARYTLVAHVRLLSMGVASTTNSLPNRAGPSFSPTLKSEEP
jgi:hypothetical protein